jgi:hypothetical protein
VDVQALGERDESRRARERLGPGQVGGRRSLHRLLNAEQEIALVVELLLLLEPEVRRRGCRDAYHGQSDDSGDDPLAYVHTKVPPRPGR